MARTLKEHKVEASHGMMAGAVVLRDLGKESHERYVTHFRDEKESYYLGHYFDNFADASRDFQDRVSRGW